MILKRKIIGPIKKFIALLIVATIVSVSSIFSATAQTMTTMEAKVVAVVNAENNTIRALELFADKDNVNESLIKRYPDCQFYIGLMEGSYEIVQARVRPQRGTTIIIFNNQTIFGDTDMVFKDQFSPGDPIKIGKTEARVISNNKGELVLKTE